MNNKIFTYLLAIFFAVFIGTGIFLVFSNKKTDNKISTEKIITPTTAPAEGLMKLTFNDKLKTSYKTGEKISINIEADSGEKNIVGYDVVFFYDPLAFEFVSANSSISDYKIYSYKKGNYLILTAVKNLSSASSSLNSKIATLVFDAKKSGKYNFSLKAMYGSEKTDMVTDKTEVLSPVLNELIAEVN